MPYAVVSAEIATEDIRSNHLNGHFKGATIGPHPLAGVAPHFISATEVTRYRRRSDRMSCAQGLPIARAADQNGISSSMSLEA